MYVLASTSPRRKELFKLIADEFDIQKPGCDEIVPEGTPVCEIPRILAEQKSKAVAEQRPEDIVIGSDTIVVLGDTVYGKPKDREDAMRMLKDLSGNTHYVITGVAVTEKGITRSFISKTAVTFYELSDEEIERYIDTGEPMDKAGAYGIQGKGSILVKKIDGDYFTVMGLPVSETYRFINSK